MGFQRKFWNELHTMRLAKAKLETGSVVWRLPVALPGRTPERPPNRKIVVKNGDIFQSCLKWQNSSKVATNKLAIFNILRQSWTNISRKFSNCATVPIRVEAFYPWGVTLPRKTPGYATIYPHINQVFNFSHCVKIYNLNCDSFWMWSQKQNTL